MQRSILLIALTALVFSGSALPADDARIKNDRAQSANYAAGELTEGEVRKVDKDARKVTIRHKEIKNLEMPPMTMVFQVKDTAMLDRVKAGDKVRFRAEQEGGTLLVTKIVRMN